MTTQPLLSDLTEDQLDAATYLGGPLRIIAGAGTGKTKTIAARYCYLVQQGVDPAQILTLTFSTKAASEMRSRILDLLGNLGGRLPIQTFHAFCRRILIDWDRTATTPSILSDGQRQPVLLEAARKLDPMNLRYYRGDQYARYLANDLATFVDRAQDDLQTPDDLYSSAVRRNQLSPRFADLIEGYRAYLTVLADHNLLDFAALTTRVVERLRNDEQLRLQTRSRFRHILVDEFQDTNAAQFELINLLVPIGDKLCVVGDPNQAIYGFRGGRAEYLTDLETAFPELKTVELEVNYRSRPAILNAANALAGHIATGSLQLQSTRDDESGEVTVSACPDAINEAHRICEHIITLATRQPHPVPLHNIAILFRSVSNDATDLLDCLREHGIAHTVSTGRQSQAHTIEPILAALRIVSGPLAWRDVTRVAAHQGADGLTLATLERLLTSSQRQQLIISGQLPDVSLPPLCQTTAYALIQTTRAVLAQRGSDIASTTYNLLCHLDVLSEETEPASAAHYARMVDEARAADESRLPLEAFVSLIAAPPDPIDDPASGAGVRVMTIHAAKGLEWPVVFVAGCSDGIFPARLRKDRELDALELIREPASDDSRGAEAIARAGYLQEERRLAYVAATRARDGLHLTWRKTNGRVELEPSPFITELDLVDAPDLPTNSRLSHTMASLRRTIRREAREAIRTDIRADTAGDDLATLLASQWAGSGAIPGITPIRDQPLPAPNTAETELQFSFSSLDTYATCPRMFMYQSVLKLDKEESGTALSLGNAVHQALEHLNAEWQRTERVPGPIAIETALNQAWDPAEFEFPELSRQLRIRAGAMIQRYFSWETENGQNRHPVAIEHRINTERGKHRLRGFIDLILRDAEGNYQIVDFKTGRPDRYKPDESLQLYLYAEAFAEGKRTTLPSAAYIALRHKDDTGFRTGESFDAKQSKTITYDPSTTEILAAQVDQHLAGIVANQFDPVPGVHCRYCRCRWICPAGMDAD